MPSAKFFQTKTSKTLLRLNSVKKYTKIQKISSPNSDMNIFTSFVFLKSSFDALDRLYRPDRPRVVGAVLDRLSLFWDDFYTMLTVKNLTKSLDSSKLFGKVEI